MKSLRNLPLAILLFLAMPLAASASSMRGAWVNSLQMMAEAIWGYYDAYKTLPTDIVDAQGKPLLSWRVRLLPFIEQNNLFEQFRLNEPWDSPHNRELIDKIPHTYLNPYYADADAQKLGKSYMVAPRGPKTFFGAGKPRVLREIKNPMAVMVLGVDPEHAPIWTKPEDVTYDPANPETGLGRWKMVVLANKEVRSIPDGTDPDLVRVLFSIDKAEPFPLELPWHEVLNHHAVGDLIKGCFLISLMFMLAGLAVIYRLLLRKPTSPGEMFFLIIGVQQMVFVLAFMMCYRYQVLPMYFRRNEHQLALWTFPGLAGAFAAIVPVFWFRSYPGWRVLFAFLLAWLAILVFESQQRHQDFHGLVSVTTIGQPFSIALAGMVMASMTSSRPLPESARRRWHWAGIAAAMIPVVWFFYSWAQGLVAPRDFFVRIRE